MPNITLILLAALGVQTLVLIVLVWFLARAYKRVRQLNVSFAKLGYLVREDIRQNFEEAAHKALELHQQTADDNKQVVEAAIKQVLADSGDVMQAALAKAEHEAGQVVLKAQQQAQQIRQDAMQETEQYQSRLVDHTAEAVEWALEQFLKDDIGITEHEQMVQSLIQVYLDEHRRF